MRIFFSNDVRSYTISCRNVCSCVSCSDLRLTVCFLCLLGAFVCSPSSRFTQLLKPDFIVSCSLIWINVWKYFVLCWFLFHFVAVLFTGMNSINFCATSRSWTTLSKSSCNRRHKQLLVTLFHYCSWIWDMCFTFTSSAVCVSWTHFRKAKHESQVQEDL